MANPEHLKILKKGVEYWNKWREENSKIRPDLSVAVLGKANLSKANLRGADLRVAKLIGVNLSAAILSLADLSGANLKGANLCGAHLNEVNLTLADLSGADLSLADLFRTNFSDCELNNVTFSGAILWQTQFNNLDLSNVHGLPETTHYGQSYIDIATFYKSQGNIPVEFLRKAGIPEDFIKNYLPSIGKNPLEFYSSFISYNHEDKTFAKRLYEKFQMRGIRCWLDEHKILPGDDIYEQVDRGIRLWDKILLCASEHSLTSWWVDDEIDKAFSKERELRKKHKKRVLALIPLDLDGYMFKDEWKPGYQQQVRRRLAAKFEGWERDNSIFEREVEKVIEALRIERGVFDKPPEQKL